MDKQSFTISKPEFDETNYKGRFLAFRKTCNPLIAFYPNSKIIEMQKLIADQKAKEEAQF